MTKVAVYGASGYTGKLVLGELSRHDLDVVAVGRDAVRLRGVAGTAVVRVAGVADRGALTEAFRGSDVVINCVAPFVLYGESVVAAAIETGCHYVDISGEQLYVQRLFDVFAEPAERAGVTVLPMVNEGGFVGDLLVSRASQHFEVIDDIVLAHHFTGESAQSRGSMRSMLANVATFTNGGLVYVNGEWRENVAGEHTSMVFPGNSAPSPVARIPLPEIATIPRHVKAGRVEGVAHAALLEAFSGVTTDTVETLPDGPTARTRAAMKFSVIADLTGEGTTIRATASGTDTYGTAAAIAVRVATSIAQGGTNPGVLAPAQAFGASEFLESLATQEIRVSIKEWDSADDSVLRRS